MAQANDFDMLEQIMHLDSISESSISSLQILSDVRLNRCKVDESSDDDDELLFLHALSEAAARRQHTT